LIRIKNALYLAISLLAFSCKDEIAEPVSGFQGLSYPDYFPKPHYQFVNNKLTEAGHSLGRELFFDPILSSDSSISCGSCHSQPHAFSDHNGAFSVGVNQKKGDRNAPPIFNLAWSPNFMWDGGVNHLEIMPLSPIINPLEMNETISNVLVKLNRHSGYKQKFKSAFGKEIIDDQMLFYALTQYQGTIVSASSRYDAMRKGEISFTTDEQAGYQLYQTHCSNCHTEPLFTDFTYRNNGIDTNFTDLGRGRITQNTADNGKFKVPSLRNIELTYPYMHDGRFFTIDMVLDHYSEGIKSSATIDGSLSKNKNFSQVEKKQIITFLYSLTDYTLLSNRFYARPK
jgi:cytochrome c peroxidase